MEKWQRFRFLPVIPLGENGKIVTGSKEHVALSRQAAAEGMVLLKNQQAALPLPKGSKVALFGKASVDYVKGGGGSGDVTVAYVRNLCQAMAEKEAEGKVQAFAPLCAFYEENVAAQRQEGKKPGLTEEPELPTALLQQAAEWCDTAIISICRFSQEGSDRKGEANDGDFYLSEAEQKMVEAVTGAFSKVIVVLNVGGMVDSQWFRENDKIQAVLLGWQGGMEGACAQADILCGDVNPSGKLVDTFAKSFDDYPSSYNFNESKDYVCYTEDIFVGYRYFETIPGAAEKVNYPFGYGLSYTTFSICCDSVTQQDDQVRLAVTVTNDGCVAGKEVVQVYSGAENCRLDMAARELRAFAKTKLLAPGESQTLEISYGIPEMASYDEEKAAYVLLAGSYPLYVGNSVRNTQKVFTLEIPQERLVRQVKNRCVPKKLNCRMKADGTYAQQETGEYTPVDALEELPPKARWKAEHILPNTYGGPIPEDRITIQKVIDGEETLEAFLEGLTDEELATLVGGCPNVGVADTMGVGHMPHLQLPAFMTVDGPAGVRIVPDRGVNTTAWPVATLLACTWNPEILEQVGTAGAMEAEENNFAMWLTPGMNIHRSPLCGRNFEYYSEDPLLTGKMAAAMVRGIQKRNVSACIKHFCCNNKEFNRAGCDSRVSERALREIYLKGFEIAIREGDTWALMTSYNILNGTYTSENGELLRGILREEWGYEGLVIADWANWSEQCREIPAGNNVRMPLGSPKRVMAGLEKGLYTREDLIYNVRYLLKFVLRLD